ncbi:hypothetical protein D3C87_1805870 [compost metagenome]
MFLGNSRTIINHAQDDVLVLITFPADLHTLAVGNVLHRIGDQISQNLLHLTGICHKRRNFTHHPNALILFRSQNQEFGHHLLGNLQGIDQFQFQFRGARL